ncbi:MAG: hypothetical protein ABI042_03065, partial [Verrucomicrobiota bacterium]
FTERRGNGGNGVVEHEVLVTISSGVFCIAALQKKTRLFVTAFMKIMQQVGFGRARELASEFVQPRKDGKQVGFRTGTAHRRDKSFQFKECFQK